MSILQKQKQKDPNAGYARDFIDMLADVLQTAISKKTKIITNAGGINPTACARAVADLAKLKGVKPKIAVVQGDDIMHRLAELGSAKNGLANMENGEEFSKISGRVLSANVYFGATSVVEALKSDADIIVTGRVTDTGITLAPMIHEFGWALNDWDKLAAGIVAGHIIECGTQACGGNFSDWRLVESYHNIGFPIVVMRTDGSFEVTKHEGTGGLVSVDTVREQLFYEMGDPGAYITPDVVADFSSIRLEQVGKDRVRVFGIKGFEPTPFYKVSMAYADGYKCVNSILVSGPDAEEKARVFADIFWQKAPKNIEASETEFFGWNACHASLSHSVSANEILLRFGARAREMSTLKKLSKIVPSLILGGPAGVAVTGGVSKPQEVVSYWPALIPKEKVFAEVGIFDYESNSVSSLNRVNAIATGNFGSANFARTAISTDTAEKALRDLSAVMTDFSKGTPLARICLARSGDKGDSANIGVLARSKPAYEFLCEYLTAQRIKDWFQELCHGKVIRYEVPGLLGLNFILEESLGGGGTMTMRSDAQGKTFAQAVLAQTINIPKNVLASIEPQ